MFDETVVILAGGYGSRLGEYSEKIPKPLVKIGNDPIIIHIMRLWNQAGFKNFIIAGGYKVSELQNELYGKDWSDYFYNATLRIVDTGIDTGTGGRIKQLESLLTERFFVCYGDGLTNYPLETLVLDTESNYIKYNSICTLLLNHPTGRFGYVESMENGLVSNFSEKPIFDKWINSGFFGMYKHVLQWIEKDSDMLEVDVFPKIADARLLASSKITDKWFWHPMDTPKDVRELTEMWEAGNAPWKIWE